MSKVKAIREHFKKDPIDCLCDWVPFFITVVSIIFVIVALVMFAKNGGYSAQVSTLTNRSFFGLKFTLGTVGVLQGAAFTVIIVLLLAFETIVNVLGMAKKCNKVVGWLIKLYGFLSAVVVFAWILLNRILPESVQVSFREAMKLDEKSLARLSWIIGIVLLLSWIAIFISTDNAEGIAAVVIGIIIAFVIAPLIVLIIENAINIAIVIVFLLITIVLIASIIKVSANNEKIKLWISDLGSLKFWEKKNSEDDAADYENADYENADDESADDESNNDN